MKKLMTLMLGLSFVLGSVAVVFAQDKPVKTAKKAGKKKPAKKKTADTAKKGA